MVSQRPTFSLPPMALFPTAAWRHHLVPEEWEACLDAWISLAEAHMSLSALDFARLSSKDESLASFLVSFMAEVATSHDISPSMDVSRAKQLRKLSFLLTYRLLEVEAALKSLTDWTFLADVSKIYGKSHAAKLVTMVWRRSAPPLEVSMGSLKACLIKELDAGLKGDLPLVETQLKRLNHLLHASSDASAFFMAGTDFLDSLISCFKLMNPPLRKAILSTTYLCLIGLTEGEKPKFSSLVDQLYSLKSAGDVHKAGPTSANDSLVAELVTNTPILKQVQLRIDAGGSGSSRAKSVIAALENFRKVGSSGRPHPLVKRKFNKGKGVAKDDDVEHGSHGQIHIHRMSLVSQIQDLFPDLGSSFAVKMLDEYNDDAEEVIAHLLEGPLPAHLDKADRAEELESTYQMSRGHAPGLAPHSTPTQLPARRNVFDGDDFDQLAVDTSRLHFGSRDPAQTADDILLDRSTAPNKAAIFSALAAFDLDDDERDDTYDIADVGGTVDSAIPGTNLEEGEGDVGDSCEEVLFRAFKTTPRIFDRDAGTRRGKPRLSLKEQTRMTDEAIEGWALMLSQDPRQLRRLEAKFATFSGGQTELAPTAWRASPGGSGTEDSDIDGNNRGRGGFRGRAGRGGRGRVHGNVAGPTGEKDTEVARQRKEANKGARANHNRRDQRAKKMARGGFPG